MSSNKMTEGVGKKIVEALKQQSDVDIIPVNEQAEAYEEYETSLENQEVEEAPTEESVEESIEDSAEEVREEVTAPSSEEVDNVLNTLNFNPSSAIENAINNPMLNFQQQANDINLSAVDDMELPGNVAVLKQLITKLPAGVSKQTGALIIRQTMEALGVSMPNVLQEAQQVQEQLTQSVRECQTSVIEYKKQINLLEMQAQKQQRQFAAINDIISLFIQTN